MGTVMTVSLGLLAAAAFGGASVLEERSTKQVPPRAALSPRLLIDLVRQPLFLAAIGVNVAGAVGRPRADTGRPSSARLVSVPSARRLSAAPDRAAA